MFSLRRAVQAAPRQVARRTCAPSHATWQQTPGPYAHSYATSKAASNGATSSDTNTKTAPSDDDSPAATAESAASGKDDTTPAPPSKPSSGSTRAPRASSSTFASRASAKYPPNPAAGRATGAHDATLQYPALGLGEGGPAVQEIDWTTSYYGLGVAPVTKEQATILARPLATADIEVKPDGIIYLPEIKYRRRLNEVFGPMGWGLAPRGDAIVGSNIVTREYALIAQGRFVAQAQGENAYFSPDQLPSSVEGTKSNALMRCCKDLGIGSELWDPEFIRKFKKSEMQEVWVEHATTKKKRTLWYKKGAVDVVYPWKKVK